MPSNREPNQRRSLRLIDYDYAQAGLYFVTLCTHQRQTLFGTVCKGIMQESPAGLVVKNTWETLSARFPFVELDDFVTMPNHLHGLLRIKPMGEGQGGRILCSPRQFPAIEHNHPVGTKAGSLGRIMQAFKSLTTHEYIVGVKQDGWPTFDGKVWQRDYYDHIVRDEVALNNMRRYIADNPLMWEQDEENPQGINGLR